MRTHLKIYLLSNLIVFSGSLFSKEIYLACSLTDKSNTVYDYSFVFNPKKETFFWINGTQNFMVIRNTSSQLWAWQEMKFRNFPHDRTYFRLNRVSGEAEMSYVRKPSAQEIAKCKKEQSFGCESFFVLEERSENGRCRLTERAIE